MMCDPTERGITLSGESSIFPLKAPPLPRPPPYDPLYIMYVLSQCKRITILASLACTPRPGGVFVRPDTPLRSRPVRGSSSLHDPQRTTIDSRLVAHENTRESNRVAAVDSPEAATSVRFQGTGSGAPLLPFSHVRAQGRSTAETHGRAA